METKPKPPFTWLPKRVHFLYVCETLELHEVRAAFWLGRELWHRDRMLIELPRVMQSLYGMEAIMHSARMADEKETTH